MLKEAQIEVLNRFSFEISPAGIKYSVKPPGDFHRLESSMTLCEILKHAQEG
jgi:uncharacterized protein (DUF169 family)